MFSHIDLVIFVDPRFVSDATAKMKTATYVY